MTKKLTIENVDQAQWNFAIDTLVAKRNKVDDYLHGRCNIFALAFAKLYKEHNPDNHEVKICVVIEEDFDDAQFLAHAYILFNGVSLDARGMITDHEIEEYKADAWRTETYLFSIEDLESHCIRSLWGKPSKNEIEEIQTFIKNNKEIYEPKNMDHLFHDDEEFMNHEKMLSVKYHHQFSMA